MIPGPVFREVLGNYDLAETIPWCALTRIDVETGPAWRTGHD